MAPEIREASPEQTALLHQLLDAGLLIETEVTGVYGHNEVFERLRLNLGDMLSKVARENGAIRLQFPPVLPLRDFETSGYVANFPHLAGSIFSFEGTEQDAKEQARHAAAHEGWSEHQVPTQMTMVPAACYPVYPAIARRGPLAAGGVFVDAGGSWVFRHEPSLDPARRQIFHQHELVRIGEPDTVNDWRMEWADRGVELLTGLGLDAQLETANDPFFGRGGRMLAANQRAQELKFELLVPISEPEPTACASFNRHGDHFGEAWGIKLADGSVAHTACVGFGHERIVLALLKTHGLDPNKWPDEVRSRLWD